MNDIKIAHKPKPTTGCRRIGHEKRGSRDYLRKRKVELFDALNRIVHKKPGKNQKCKGNKGCWKSIKVGTYYLNFITFLPNREFKKRFGKLLKAKSTDIDIAI